MFWPFGKHKSKKIKEDSEMTEDEKQIVEAKKDIAKKGPDSQTEKDRIDESVGEQEKLDGNKDSQTAKDRVDESEGAKKADEKRSEEKKEEGKKDDRPSWAAEMSEAMKKMVAMFEKFTSDMAEHHNAEEKHMAEEGKREKETDEKTSKELDKKLTAIYGE